MNLQFEWDDQKASLNFKKHGIDFEEAKTVFKDPLAYIFDDEWHSVGEKREIIIGHDDKNHLVLVCYTEKNQIIRIISARLATKKERQDYEKYRQF
ncbi:BrnT family toxin [Oscillatoria salina]|uniref:BrnT family toxin n=1 Tax=Oscillatoria salina TaxID=331517 RepID=UPI0013B6F465|nr:BrnT family toxin [Oscillatoria salina]MBZ8182924.1 BrnT family toxin [Oscillatoria salina IIICB1]NET86569.1 BrnT family toxin [Kamptonema sp. SIO1D9]